MKAREESTSVSRVRLGAVVLNYRNWPGVRRCLDDLSRQSAEPSKIVLVDNASGDGSADRVSDAYPEVDVLRLSSNNGYAAGMNAGLRSLDLLSFDFVVLCTHDVQLESDCLEQLIAVAESDRRTAVLAPLLGWASRRDQVWSAGGTIRRATGRPGHVRTPSLIADARREPLEDRVWVDGAVMLVRSDVFGEVGWLDERFFLYSEEVEWLRRVRATGRRVVTVPNAVAWQEPGMAPPYLETRNRILLYKRGRDAWYLALAIVAGLTASLRSLRAGRRAEARLRLVAVVDGITGRLRRDLALQR